jgi:putative solute:sodium symporter small subunit
LAASLLCVALAPQQIYTSLTNQAQTFSPWSLQPRGPVARSTPHLLASPQNATNWPGFGREEKPMLHQLLQDDLAQVLVDAHNSPLWARGKKLLAVMLGLWLSYFLLVNWFVHSLNKIAVPVIGIPLDTYLAVQGAAIVFAVALFRFARSAD